MIQFALRRSQNVRWQGLTVDRAARAPSHAPDTVRALVHRPVGRRQVDDRQPGGDRAARAVASTPICSTATTSATASTVTSGFTDADRVENIRRVGEVAKLMVDAGLIVLVSFISPFRSERQMARALFERRRVHRGVRRHAAGGRRGARPQGAVQEGEHAASWRTSPGSTPHTSRPRTPNASDDDRAAAAQSVRRRHRAPPSAVSSPRPVSSAPPCPPPARRCEAA